MAALIGRRLLSLIPTLLIVTFVVYGLVLLIPGDAAVTLAGGADNATPEMIDQIREQLNLDEPFLQQYVSWLGDALQGDLGTSIIDGVPVSDELGRRVPITLGIVIYAVLLGTLIGVPAGVIAGMRPGSGLDRGTMLGTSLGLAIPSFFLAMVLVLVFAVNLNWFPATLYSPPSDGIVDWLKSITLPAVALSLALAAGLARQVRAALADSMSSNYVKTAWAKGGTVRVVVAKHALKNASIPAITIVGFSVAALLGGAVIVEQVFAIPGLGTYAIKGVLSHDLPIIQGVALVLVLANVIMALIIDIMYGVVNPRVRAS